ncbi:uncharacterized protein LOC131025510 [Salvia miltiorrhiza]|uniref:uncharacterized protein LOC131025510 n=1 Tax=Salvia miltiorrhiza TaxID=226208 RepID=UPI0025AD8A16|nr:uncharacterized protein LOC131025510 [Salvia miltiorrhiza]
MCIEEFRNDVKRRFNIAIPNGRLYRAKAHSLQLLRGTVQGHYNKLRSYILELMRVDRGGRFELLCGDGSIFQGLYIGFSALKRGFLEGCRPIIGLDGCFLKTHLGGQLLCAIGKDGNNQMYPIAWAVVEVENEACWRWFLGILLEELGIHDGNGFTLISDQQKGLTNAVKELAPLAEHRNCARHVYMNWKKQFKGVALKNLFWQAVRATYVEEWDAVMETLKTENMMAYDDLLNRDPTRFCKAFFSTCCVSDMMDNNVSETFNGYILSARGKHIIHMLEDIRSGLRERQYKKFQHVMTVTDILTPAVRKKLEKLKSLARYCTSHPGLGGKFEVSNKDDMFIVSLPEKTCSCRGWEITGIPCVHAVSAINFMKEDPAVYVHNYLSTETYLRAYSFPLEPINGERLWPKAEGYPVQPPQVRIMPGRPKKKRIRDTDEKDPKQPSSLRKTGCKMTCQRCLQEGHNSRGCMNDEVQKPDGEKRKPGRPRKYPIPEPTEATIPTNPTDTTEATTRGRGRGRPKGSGSGRGKGRARDIAMERQEASKGIGLYCGEQTGNSYIASGSGLQQIPRGEEICLTGPTQESQSNP